jgi:hypothetical protein
MQLILHMRSIFRKLGLVAKVISIVVGGIFLLFMLLLVYATKGDVLVLIGNILMLLVAVAVVLWGLALGFLSFLSWLFEKPKKPDEPLELRNVASDEAGHSERPTEGRKMDRHSGRRGRSAQA